VIKFWGKVSHLKYSLHSAIELRRKLSLSIYVQSLLTSFHALGYVGRSFALTSRRVKHTQISFQPKGTVPKNSTEMITFFKTTRAFYYLSRAMSCTVMGSRLHASYWFNGFPPVRACLLWSVNHKIKWGVKITDQFLASCKIQARSCPGHAARFSRKRMLLFRSISVDWEKRVRLGPTNIYTCSLAAKHRSLQWKVITKYLSCCRFQFSHVPVNSKWSARFTKLRQQSM